jgi:carboxypeptidase PM20D1
VFANLWCFGGLLAKFSALLGGDLDAMMRTTQSFNMAQGSKQANVIPSAATAVANLRLLNTTTPEDARLHFEKVIRNPDVEIDILNCQEASPYADPTCKEFAAMAKAIRHTWGENVIVSPYLMMACSDSRHYSRICRNVFKFSAVAMTKEQRALIHNENERVSVEKVWESVEFFTRLVRYL